MKSEEKGFEKRKEDMNSSGLRQSNINVSMLVSAFLVQGSGPERLARPYTEGPLLHRPLLVLKATV